MRLSSDTSDAAPTPMKTQGLDGRSGSLSLSMVEPNVQLSGELSI